jgi:hypothetical protein
VDGENIRASLPKNVACDVVYDTTEPIFEVVPSGLSPCFCLAPLDPAVVKLIDVLARFLAREDDARDRSATQPALVERDAIDSR